MQMRIFAGGMGLGIFGNAGVTFGKVAHLQFRNSEGEGWWSMSVYEDFDFGSDGPHSGVATISTEWIPVNASAYPWLRKKQDLVGKRTIIKVKGVALAIGAGTVSIDLKILDDYHQVVHRVAFYEIQVQSKNLSLDTIDISGRIRRYDRRTERLLEQGDLEPGTKEWKHMVNERQQGHEIPKN